MCSRIAIGIITGYSTSNFGTNDKITRKIRADLKTIAINNTYTRYKASAAVKALFMGCVSSSGGRAPCGA
jgi:hypothetical protein